MQKKMYCGIIALTMALPAAARAETGTPVVLDEVVVSATRTSEQRTDIPNAVILFDRFDLEESPAKSLGEFLGGAPGIDWRTKGNYGGAAETVQLRGMAASETQVLVNGLSYNSPSLGSADLAAIPMNGIEGIEVVKGAGSLLYGSGAMAGTVNLLSKRPRRDGMDLTVEAGYGSEGTYRLSAEQGMFVSEEFGYYLTVGRKETDGFRENSDLTHNDASLNLIFDRGKAFSVSLYGDTVHREYGVPGIRPPAGTGDHYVNGVKFYSAEAASLVNRGKTEDSHAMVEVKGEPTAWLSLMGRADYTSMSSYDLSRNNADGWTSLAGEGQKTWVNNRVYGMQANAEVRPLVGLSLLAGVDYKNHDWDTSEINLDASGQDQAGGASNKARLFTEGVFLEAQYRPLAWLKLLAGLRQEAHSTFGYENLPHFGLVLNPTAATTIKASHGKHFKAPTPNDLFWPDSDFVRGNPGLDAQTGWHSDLTLEQKLAGDTLFATLGWFDWDVDGKITWAQNPAFPGPFGDKWTPTNLNRSTGRGFEAGLSYTPSPALRLSLDYTYTKAEDDTGFVTGRQAQYVPRHQAKAGASWRLDPNLLAGLVVRYIDERPYYRSDANATPTDILPSAFTVDFHLERRFAEQFLLKFDANNLLDAEYDSYVGSYVNGSGSTVYGTYPTAGRSLFLSLGYEF